MKIQGYGVYNKRIETLVIDAIPGDPEFVALVKSSQWDLSWHESGLHPQSDGKSMRLHLIRETRMELDKVAVSKARGKALREIRALTNSKIAV